MRRLESEVIENNLLRSIGVGDTQDSEVLITHNVIVEEIDIGNAYVEIRDNEFPKLRVMRSGIALVEGNHIHYGIIMERNCKIELNSNTIIREKGNEDYPLIIDSRQLGDISVVLRNNILISFVPLSLGIAEGVDVQESGFNCFWGMERAYGDRDDLCRGDIMADPLFVGGHPYEYQLRADSPCIDTGDPDSPEDPDETRADMGCYYYEQENGMPPAIISRHHAYTGWGMDFSYAAGATDMDGAIEFEFDGLPEWLEVEDDGRRDFVSDSVVVSGEVPEDQEDFVFIVTARDEDGLEDTLSVQVFVYPFTVLTGQIGGVLTREGSPYLVADTAWVVEGDSLIIEPGCLIYSDETQYEDRLYSTIISHGFVRAIGTEEDSIFFLTLNGRNARQFLKVYGNSDLFSEYSYCRFNDAGLISFEHDVNMYHCFNEAQVSILGYETPIHFDFQYNEGRGSFRGSGIVANNILGGISVGGDSIEVINNTIRKGSISVFKDVLYAHIYNNVQEESQDGYFHFWINTYYGEEHSEIVIESNVIRHCTCGMEIGGENADIIVVNNIINGTREQCIELHGDDNDILIANNIFSNSLRGCYLWTIYGNYLNNKKIINNLVINNDIVFSSYNPQIVFNNFQYNACFDFDTLSNDTSYIGRLTQVNANSDSCDAGFNIFLDPHIVSLDSLDFHLYEDSPLIDAGNPDSAFCDIDGSINDIGLYGGPFGEGYEYPRGVGVSDVPVPEGFTLGRPYPNPFNITTNFVFNLPAPGIVDINIYDTIGRLILSDKLNDLQAGSHRYTWQGIDNRGGQLPTGIYYFELTYKGAKLVKRAVLLK